MPNPKSINELLTLGGARLGDLKARSLDRTVALEHVCTALPPQMAAAVVSAGIDKGMLTIGVTGAQWAARLRYMTDSLRVRVGGSMGIAIEGIRIKVVPPRA